MQASSESSTYSLKGQRSSETGNDLLRDREGKTKSTLRRKPCAMKVARTVSTEGMEKRAVR